MFEEPDDRSHLREIGDQAVWTLSTAKPGNGVEQLRDDSTETYWQSDGTQPHFVNIQFHKKMRIERISFYTDYRIDESYTASKLSIREGNDLDDLHEVKLVELEEPSGWVHVDLSSPEASTYPGEVLRAHFIQIAIIANHQNGKDTHMRQIKIFGPRRLPTQGLQLPAFQTAEFLQFATVR
eukprot:TRINITY_DN24220_c0_g1_i3.p1 TRINITY_DN24220_c0_g1~~TRINITY_DN24220_c0_g1_i3.p1  ORF type:complete len:181 (+),score=29.27 TRINITY_DN24220_c0_g1_i3:237-779(+)